MHTEHATNASDVPRPTGPGSPAPTCAYPDSVPVLWQLQISHYVEKVRWALDYKRIPHIRHSLLPGLHAVKTRRLSGDTSTVPVLTLDGRSIGDSTRIIAAIEERWPQPPLYPEDEAQRCRALELEEFFDEELGPHIRRAFYHEVLPRPELVVPLFTQGRRRPPRALLRAGFPVLRVAMRQRFEISAELAAHSRAKMVAAMDRLERETSRAAISSATRSRSRTSPQPRCSTEWRGPRSSRIRWSPSTTCQTRGASSLTHWRSAPAANGSHRCTIGTAASQPNSPLVT